MNEAIEMDSTNELSYGYLGIIHARMGQFDKADIYGKKAIEIDPENAINVCFYSQNLAYQGAFGRSAEWLEKSLEIGDELITFEWLNLPSRPNPLRAHDPDLWDKTMRKYFPEKFKN